MRYLPLFELCTRHAYYSDGRSPDFVIEPTSETSRLIKNTRCIIKALPDGLRVVTSVKDTGDTFIPFAAGTVLGFEMRIKNPDFALITDPADISTAPSPLYSNAAIAVDEKELELTSNEVWSEETFNVTKPSSAETFVLRGTPIDGVALADFEIVPADSVAAVVAYDAQDKLLSVDSQAASPGDAFIIKYPVYAPMSRGVYARIEIHINNTLPNLAKPSKQPCEFQISFHAKKAKWAYYCLTDLDNADTAYNIIDTPPINEDTPLVFSDANRRDLNTTPDPLDELAVELAERYPSLKQYRFLSDAPVTCRQKARKHLALHVNGIKLPGVLSNPSVRQFSTGNVKVGDIIQQQDWLFEIVKVITNNGA